MRKISMILMLLSVVAFASCKKNHCDKPACIDRSMIDPNIMCPEVIDPVCGCNGITYNNECDAKRSGVTNWTKGSCQKKGENECIDPSKRDSLMLCPAVYAPVCGCDGKTYGNDCEASKSGVKSWTEGACYKK